MGEQFPIRLKLFKVYGPITSAVPTMIVESYNSSLYLKTTKLELSALMLTLVIA